MHLYDAAGRIGGQFNMARRIPGQDHPKVLRYIDMLLQRKPRKHGASLGKTTGWIHRAALKTRNVEMLCGVNYERIGDEGRFITFGADPRDGTVLAVDSVVPCAGQEPLRELQAPVQAAGIEVHLIGGAFEAGGLDAKRAIDQGTRLAATLRGDLRRPAPGCGCRRTAPALSKLIRAARRHGIFLPRGGRRSTACATPPSRGGG